MLARKSIRSSLVPPSTVQYSALSARDDNDNWGDDNFDFDSMSSSTPDTQTPPRRDSPVEIEALTQAQGSPGRSSHSPYSPYNSHTAGAGVLDNNSSNVFDASTSSASNISRGNSIAHRHSTNPNKYNAGGIEGQAERQDRDDYDDNKRDHHNGAFVKSTHWSRCWLRYVAVASILVAISLLVTLLVLKPWQHRYKLAPISNAAVKDLPIEQPIWPIPKEFENGTEKVVLSEDFQIRVEASSATGGVTSSVIEAAIARCLDRLQIKRNTTVYPSDAMLASTTAATAGGQISELVIIVDNSEARLEYGMKESYMINITLAGSPNTGTQMLNHKYELVADTINKRADPLTDGGAGGSKQSTATLKASTQWGVLHGLETFSQLVMASAVAASTTASFQETQPQIQNTLEIPNAPWSIFDEPRYSHRGFLLDTSRHFVPVKDIIRTLEAMSIVKLNVFHWHVLDQQTYPLVSKTFPELTAKGAERADRIYSYEDVANIVQYGHARGIRVIPEFDAPGHTASWGRAFPNITVCVDSQPHNKYGAEPPPGQLDPLEPFTYKVLDGLIKEWSVQFQDNQVHIGGDEINYDCWKTSERLKDYIDHPASRERYESKLPATIEIQDTKNKLRSFGSSSSQSGEDRLLDLYLTKVLGMYLKQGKRPIVWEELALEHNVKLPESTIVHVWKNARNAKKIINQGLPVILSSAEYWYLDCGAGSWLIGSLGQSWCKYATWQRIYSYSWEDELTEDQQKMVLGGEIAMWSEQTDGHNLDPNVWPRSAAAAEVLWSGSRDSHGQVRPLIQAFRRLSQVRERLVEMGVNAAPISPNWCGKHPEACLA